MTNLIPITQSVINSESVQSVNARELHAFLKVATRFNDWISARIKEYQFVENQDFATFTENPVKGRPAKEYAITLDMAKELSMVERNAKGKEARQYFIEVDKAYHREGPRELKKYVEWLKAREKGKEARKLETDVIKSFIEYATEQGSRNARHYYINLTKGAYRALFILEKGGEWKGLRNHLSTLQLTQLSVAEWVAQKYIGEGMILHMHYKDIYRYAIAKVEEMAAILGKQLPGQAGTIHKLGQ